MNADDGEAILDAEYASAAAPSAAIVMATCRSSFTTFGGLIAIQNLINGANPPAIISLSYGECEASNGASGNAAFNAIFQQGVAEGVSIFVASGDEDAGGCGSGTAVTHGIGVSAFASTPYNVAVGGTGSATLISGPTPPTGIPANTAADSSSHPPGNSLERSRQPTPRDFPGLCRTYGASGFCNSGARANFLNNIGGGAAAVQPGRLPPPGRQRNLRGISQPS